VSPTSHLQHKSSSPPVAALVAADDTGMGVISITCATRARNEM